MNLLRVTVVATVLNEYACLPAWLEGLEKQTRPADEFVIIDGGSTDGTWELLDGWQPDAPKLVIRCKGCAISAGRNLGIMRATGEIVAVTDAGTVAREDWLERLIRPLADLDVDVAAGFFEPAERSVWTKCLAAATLPDLVEIDDQNFLPSSRSVAFRRSWFDLGCRYPEWLDYCEDLVFDLQLKRAGARFQFVPDAVVVFRPRPGPKSFAVQYFRYARGDGKAGLHFRRHAIRYLVYLTLAVVTLRRRPHELAAVGLAGFLYLREPHRRLERRQDLSGDSTSVWLLLTLVAAQRALGDLAKMAGYPIGVLWRSRRYGISIRRSGWRNVRSDGRRWTSGES